MVNICVSCYNFSSEVVKKKDQEYGRTFMIVERISLNKESFEDQKIGRLASLQQLFEDMLTEQEWISWLSPV